MKQGGQETERWDRGILLILAWILALALFALVAKAEKSRPQIMQEVRGCTLSHFESGGWTVTLKKTVGKVQTVERVATDKPVSRKRAWQICQKWLDKR